MYSCKSIPAIASIATGSVRVRRQVMLYMCIGLYGIYDSIDTVHCLQGCSPSLLRLYIAPLGDCAPPQGGIGSKGQGGSGRWLRVRCRQGRRVSRDRCSRAFVGGYLRHVGLGGGRYAGLGRSQVQVGCKQIIQCRNQEIRGI